MSIESFRGPGGAMLRYRYDDFTDPWTDAPTVILAHGFGGFSARWYRWVPLLAGHCKVVRTDLRGLGLSQVPAESYDITVHTMALDALALLDHLELKTAIWIGEHTGALAGLMAAIRVPERFAALAIMGAPLRPRDLPAFQPDAIAKNPQLLGFRESTEFIQTHGMRHFMEESQRQSGRPALFTADYNAWYLDQMAQEDAILYAKFRTGMLETDVIPFLPQLSRPLLWVEGTYNPVLIPAWRALLQAHPQVRFVEVEGSGHQIAYQQPEACVAAVRRFLTDLGLWRDPQQVAAPKPA